MKCPVCGHGETAVIDSRPARDESVIRRRRSCLKCGHRFSTCEQQRSQVTPTSEFQSVEQSDQEDIDETVNIAAQIPRKLCSPLQDYLDSHPDWDCDRVASVALSLFLMQNGSGDRVRIAARVYLDAMFKN